LYNLSTSKHQLDVMGGEFKITGPFINAIAGFTAGVD